MNKIKGRKIVVREIEKEKVGKKQIWDIDQETGRKKIVFEENLEENFKQNNQQITKNQKSKLKIGFKLSNKRNIKILSKEQNG